MEALFDIGREVLGLSLKSEQMGVGQMCARALLMYIALVVIVRFGKKRFLGKATAFDAVLVIIIGSIAARAITGGAPLFPALGAEIVLVGFHWICSGIAEKSPRFSNLIKGTSTVIIADGQVDEKALSHSHMSEDDLQEDLRLQGVQSASHVKEARLERSGKLSVLKE